MSKTYRKTSKTKKDQRYNTKRNPNQTPYKRNYKSSKKNQLNQDEEEFLELINNNDNEFAYVASNDLGSIVNEDNATKEKASFEDEDYLFDEVVESKVAIDETNGDNLNEEAVYQDDVTVDGELKGNISENDPSQKNTEDINGENEEVCPTEEVNSDWYTIDPYQSFTKTALLKETNIINSDSDSETKSDAIAIEVSSDEPIQENGSNNEVVCVEIEISDSGEDSSENAQDEMDSENSSDLITALKTVLKTIAADPNNGDRPIINLNVTINIVSPKSENDDSEKVVSDNDQENTQGCVIESEGINLLVNGDFDDIDIDDQDGSVTLSVDEGNFFVNISIEEEDFEDWDEDLDDENSLDDFDDELEDFDDDFEDENLLEDFDDEVDEDYDQENDLDDLDEHLIWEGETKLDRLFYALIQRLKKELKHLMEAEASDDENDFGDEAPEEAGDLDYRSVLRSAIQELIWEIPAFRKDILSSEAKQQLEDLGFVWEQYHLIIESVNDIVVEAIIKDKHERLLSDTEFKGVDIDQADAIKFDWVDKLEFSNQDDICLFRITDTITLWMKQVKKAFLVKETSQGYSEENSEEPASVNKQQTEVTAKEKFGKNPKTDSISLEEELSQYTYTETDEDFSMDDDGNSNSSKDEEARKDGSKSENYSNFFSYRFSDETTQILEKDSKEDSASQPAKEDDSSSDPKGEAHPILYTMYHRLFGDIEVIKGSEGGTFYDAETALGIMGVSAQLLNNLPKYEGCPSVKVILKDEKGREFVQSKQYWPVNLLLKSVLEDPYRKRTDMTAFTLKVLHPLMEELLEIRKDYSDSGSKKRSFSNSLEDYLWQTYIHLPALVYETKGRVKDFYWSE